MERAVAFHRDSLKLPLKFAAPDRSEFDTGGTTLALHPAAEGHPAGSVELDLDVFYEARTVNGIVLVRPPTELPGRRIARFLDSEGWETSVGG
ncbi:MAG: hypothetical protein BGP16_08325 [Sphingobium sp. 66-54]|nr:MAG: hypothetical protein BGP16_08325 [Sphingobium sp. 66-54]